MNAYDLYSSDKASQALTAIGAGGMGQQEIDLLKQIFVATATSSQELPTNPYNVKNFGASGDARKVVDAVLNGTTTVTSATANFTSADVGKVVWGIETSTGVARLPKTTITAINSPTSITTATAALGANTGISLILGTDDTVAIKAAAEAADTASPKATVYLPAGGYVFSDTLFFHAATSGTRGSYNVAGDGMNATVLFPTPGFTKSGDTYLNSGMQSVTFSEYSGFGIDGSDMNVIAGSPTIATACHRMTMTNVRITSFKQATALLAIGVSDCIFNECWFEANSYFGLSITGNATFNNCYNGNHGYRGINLNGFVRWIGGTMDECSGESAYIAGGQLWASDAIIYAGTGQIAINVGVSGARFNGSNCWIEPFDTNNNCTGVRVASGAEAFLSQCRLEGSGSGFALQVLSGGNVYDGGNNQSLGTGTNNAGTISTLSL